MNVNEQCACGRLLHYRNLLARRYMDRIVAECGPTILITTGGRTWRVPRHFIALHGLKATDLPRIARRYHFAEVTEPVSVLG